MPEQWPSDMDTTLGWVRGGRGTRGSSFPCQGVPSAGLGTGVASFSCLLGAEIRSQAQTGLLL